MGFFGLLNRVEVPPKSPEVPPKSPEGTSTGYYDWYDFYRQRWGPNNGPFIMGSVGRAEWETKLQDLAWRVAGGTASENELLEGLVELKKQRETERRREDYRRQENAWRWMQSPGAVEWVDEHRNRAGWTRWDVDQLVSSLNASSYSPVDRRGIADALRQVWERRWSLMGCIERGDADAVRELLLARKRPYPLAEAVSKAATMGQVDCLRHVLDNGGDPNAAPWLGRDHATPPLISAVRNGHLEVVRLLLERGAQANRQRVRVRLSRLHIVRRISGR